ncbi:Sir2 family NAD-dependent protein deacetylase [Corynebacterium guangdongense]|uniref:protein acetyllysine N-acetyltransferase n=1 Tax=Corynebacterium guangdongense TaxID=1783348 RepID=A0ABU2A0Y8_9CORY|nr:Sir2 family NAD-dependent protein deacetylase [Corynebacterium guangdongense]MDR7330680.1 NAD-dependent SIR2 family protein deacetylase [Corynebacterium guangdongense]WJZ16695.1 NAD-dependent protein deacetylase [Corynebacterium guangdongense]
MSLQDPAVAATHAAALRSIARVVDETVTPTAPGEALDRVADSLRRGPALVLTGAGVSTDSGIPDYRSEGGRLRTGRPMTYQEFRHDPAASHRYWARGFVGWATMKRAQPNRTHYALVELEQAGLVTGVITQNVDGLHADAGTSRLIPLHGDMSHVECLDCGFREPRPGFDLRMEEANPGYRDSIAVDQSMVNPDGDFALTDDQVARFRMPGCLRCGSRRLKPDVVYFGESVPRERRARAGELLAASSSLIVAGSSLAVMSGYRLLLDAVRDRKFTAVINAGPGRGDRKADVVWRTGVGGAFDSLLDAFEL